MSIVITGASRGIGHEMLRQYRQAGKEVLGTSRAGEGYLQLDVTRPEQFAGLTQALEGQPVELLICNAGVYLEKGQNLADGYPPEMWAETFATNVTGVFLTVQALLPNLQMTPNAKIAIISSQMASHQRAPGGSYIYRSSKAAALNLGRNLAADLKGLDIAVGIYHPGWVQTDMGGDAADITAEQAAQGLIARFADLSLDSTGCFKTWDGRDHAY